MVGGDAGNSPGVSIGSSDGDTGAGPARAKAETARQALLLATQALGINAAAVNEARKERDEEFALRLDFEDMLVGFVGTGDVLVNAVRRGSLPMLRRALELGAGLDTRDEASGSTPLCLAAAYDRPDCVRLLVEPGADIDKATFNGWTPLHFAAISSPPECLRLLLEAGADASARNKKGETPFDIAEAHNNNEAAALLRQHAATEAP